MSGDDERLQCCKQYVYVQRTDNTTSDVNGDASGRDWAIGYTLRDNADGGEGEYVTST